MFVTHNCLTYSRASMIIKKFRDINFVGNKIHTNHFLKYTFLHADDLLSACHFLNTTSQLIPIIATSQQHDRVVMKTNYM